MPKRCLVQSRFRQCRKYEISCEIIADQLFRVFVWAYQALQREGHLKPYEYIYIGGLLVTLDDAECFSSWKIHCKHRS